MPFFLFFFLFVKKKGKKNKEKENEKQGQDRKRERKKEKRSHQTGRIPNNGQSSFSRLHCTVLLFRCERHLQGSLLINSEFPNILFVSSSLAARVRSNRISRKSAFQDATLTHELMSLDYENLEEQPLEKWMNRNSIDRFAELKKLLEKKKKSINCFFFELILNTEKIKYFKKFTSLVAALNKKILKIPNWRKEDWCKFLWITNSIFENCSWKFLSCRCESKTQNDVESCSFCERFLYFSK